MLLKHSRLHAEGSILVRTASDYSIDSLILMLGGLSKLISVCTSAHKHTHTFISSCSFSSSD